MEFELSKVVEKLITDIMEQPKGSPYREVAEITGALPISLDMGGALAIKPDGQIIMYDDNRQEITVPDENWRTAALVQLAKRYDELRMLAPQRPKNASDCETCGGTGVINQYGCGTCWSTGWIVDTS